MHESTGEQEHTASARSERPMIQITSTVQQYEKWLIIMPKTKQQTLSFLFMFRLLLLLLNERAHRNYLITFSKRIAYITRSIPPTTEDWKFILISPHFFRGWTFLSFEFFFYFFFRFQLMVSKSKRTKNLSNDESNINFRFVRETRSSKRFRSLTFRFL